MTPDSLVLLTFAILVVAFLYSSVGHAGASGYIAVMSLASLAPEQIKPTALSLNILVACIGSWQFWRAGYFSWRLFCPFALTSVPMAFLGGYLSLPAHVFKVIVGVVLLLSAANFIWRPSSDHVRAEPARPVALAAGGALGLLSGLTGTGGGIFLTPLLLVMRWCTTKTAAATSAFFILLNSSAGLLGHVGASHRLPGFIAPLVVAALIGGSAGSWLGSRRLSPVGIKRMLAAVLVIAGFKLVFGG
jgi:uncharacterized membrane protein YfcA